MHAVFVTEIDTCVMKIVSKLITATFEWILLSLDKNKNQMTYQNIRWNTHKRGETLALTFKGSNETVAIHPKHHNLCLR